MNYSYSDWNAVLQATPNGKTHVMIPISAVVLLHESSAPDAAINHPC
jgi:hypothetical protein